MRLEKYLFTILLVLAFATISEAATYYIREDGTVTGANKVNATSCSAAGTAMSWANHLDGSYASQDTLIVCDEGDGGDGYIHSALWSVKSDVIYDGYPEGDCNVITENGACSGMAKIQSTGGTSTKNIDLNGISDTIIQDIWFDGGKTSFDVGTTAGDSLIIRRTYLTGWCKSAIGTQQTNLIFGGANGDGNLVLSTIGETCGDRQALNHAGSAHDNTYSWNKVIATGSGGGDCITTDGSDSSPSVYNILIENNWLECPGNEQTIDIKGAYNVTVRYNIMKDSTDEQLVFHNNSYNCYAYGNFITGGERGISYREQKTPNHSNHYGAIWANIIYDTQKGGILISDLAGSSGKLFIYNNTLDGSGDLDPDSNIGRTNIAISPGVASGIDIYMANNINENPRPGATNRYGVYHTGGTLQTAEHSTYYYSGMDESTSAAWYYSSAVRTLDYMQATPNLEDDSPTGVVRDPDYDANYKLNVTSDEINDGKDLSALWSSLVHIDEGKAIHPSTDFAACLAAEVPCLVIMGDQSFHGTGWERGAFLKVEDPPVEPPPPSDIITYLYGTHYVYGQWTPSSFARTLRIGQDYTNVTDFWNKMLKGPVGGLVPGDWIKIIYDDDNNIAFTAWDGTASSRITIQDKKHLLGQVTLGDYYDIYCANDASDLLMGGHTNNRIYPCGQILFSGTEALENFQTKEDPDIWWEDYKVSTGDGGWEDYRVKE